VKKLKEKIPKPIINSLKYTSKGVWFSVKIAIYLLLFYAICFSMISTYGIYKAYDYVTAINEEVKAFKEGAVHSSKMMESFQLSPKSYLDSSKCIEPQAEWVPFVSISINLKKAVLAVEDASFYIHPGIDIESIVSALETNKKRGKKAFGASTITQQVSKNLFLNKERSYERKIKELGFTFLLEKHLSKERIFEIYLNIAQMGPCHFGCESASQFFYNKPCSKLNLQEAIDIASILANPNKYYPTNYKSKLLGARRHLIFENLYQTKFLIRDTTSNPKDSNLSQIDSTKEL
jgi:monofunctional biosynthetic peptidoglycan transglycosylase